MPMTLTEAAQYDGAVQAILAGTATDAQAKEAEAVVADLIPTLNAVANLARETQRVRVALYSLIPAEKRDAIMKVLEGENPAEPRIRLPSEKEPAPSDEVRELSTEQA